MKPTSQKIINIYVALMLINTLAASLIWGINTLFLLDAGLTNAQAFLANAFFTLGQVVFEIPTGIVADIKGRSTSYLIGTITLGVSTLLYLYAWSIHAHIWLWAISSILLGLGFTFFSGATEAWLVDALNHSGYKGTLDSVFAKGQMVSGIAMLAGSIGGGLIAQATNLGVPYILRATLLFVNFVVALIFMKDWGFKAAKSTHLVNDVKALFVTSSQFGWRNSSVRWIMLAAPFTSGVSFYAFYAMQPFLLQLYHDHKAYAIAGLAAAIVAGAQIIGSMLVPYISKFFPRRTTILLLSGILNVAALVLIGLTTQFWIAIVLLCVWGLLFSASAPVRQSYLNSLIPSDKRATVLSFDNSITSAGGAVIQPGLGRMADAFGYGPSFLGGALFSALSIPFIFLARRHHEKSDRI